MANIIAAMTNATVTTKSMRLISATSSHPGNPLVMGCSVFTRRMMACPFRQAHCQNYLICAVGVPNLWLSTPNFRELRRGEVRRIPLLGTWVNKELSTFSEGMYAA
jgi:hypothetical protein